MKKLIGLMILSVAFLCFTPRVSAQNARQKQFWNLAQHETQQLAKHMQLNKSQKAYAKRSFYNYHAETEVLQHPDRYKKHITKKEIEENLFKRLKEGLTQKQVVKFAKIKGEILQNNPPMAAQKNKKD